jgi:hypothetical protein
MTLPIEPTIPCRAPIGCEGGVADSEPRRIAALATLDLDDARVLLPMQWSEFCYACERVCTFATFAVCVEGLVVECTGCGNPRIAPFTRTNGEAA